MIGISEFSAELSCGSAPVRIFAKQGDEDSRFLRVRFLFGGKAFDLSGAEHTEIRVQKPDGTVTVNDGVIGEDGTALYPLSPQSLTAAGEGSADLILYGSGGEVISCVPARLIITPAPVGDEAVAPISEYRAFVAQLSSIESRLTAQGQSISLLQRDLTTMNQNYGRWIAELSSRLGDMSLSLLTAAEYEALAVKNPSTLYTVVDEDSGKVTQYLGETELKSGSTTIGIGTPAAKGVTTATAGVGQIVNE